MWPNLRYDPRIIDFLLHELDIKFKTKFSEYQVTRRHLYNSSKRIPNERTLKTKFANLKNVIVIMILIVVNFVNVSKMQRQSLLS